jgi:hypothetical protein
MKTRFSVLPDERRVLIGIDKANLFKAGVVYEAIKIFDEIVLRPVGKYALPKQGTYPNENSDSNAIIYSGLHLVTKDEQSESQANAT